MHYLFSVVILVHALAHYIVFMAYWDILKHEEISTKTQILDGRYDIGFARIRMLGLVWLFAGAAYTGIGIAMVFGFTAYFIPLFAISIVSLALTITGLPDTKFGLLLDIFLLPFLLMNWLFEWL